MDLNELLSLPGESFVQVAYRVILMRNADDVGLRHYLRRLSKGYGKVEVLADLIRSREAKLRARHADLAGLPNEAFVEGIYQRLLGRSPDEDGKRYYLEALDDHGNHHLVVTEIERSFEANSRNSWQIQLRAEIDELVAEESQSFGLIGWWGRVTRFARQIARLELAASNKFAQMDEALRQALERLHGLDKHLMLIVDNIGHQRSDTVAGALSSLDAQSRHQNSLINIAAWPVANFRLSHSLPPSVGELTFGNPTGSNGKEIYEELFDMEIMCSLNESHALMQMVGDLK